MSDRYDNHDAARERDLAGDEAWTERVRDRADRDGMYRSLMALRLEVPKAVADDVRAKVEAYTLQLEAERDDATAAKAWIEENWCGEDDEPETLSLLELVKRVYAWGDSGFAAAGMELQRADAANSRLRTAVDRAEAAEQYSRGLLDVLAVVQAGFDSFYSQANPTRKFDALLNAEARVRVALAIPPASPPVSMYEVIHEWLRENNPAALELCPYKVTTGK